MQVMLAPCWMAAVPGVVVPSVFAEALIIEVPLGGGGGVDVPPPPPPQLGVGAGGIHVKSCDTVFEPLEFSLPQVPDVWT